MSSDLVPEVDPYSPVYTPVSKRSAQVEPKTQVHLQMSIYDSFVVLKNSVIQSDIKIFCYDSVGKSRRNGLTLNYDKTNPVLILDSEYYLDSNWHVMQFNEVLENKIKLYLSDQFTIRLPGQSSILISCDGKATSSQWKSFSFDFTEKNFKIIENTYSQENVKLVREILPVIEEAPNWIVVTPAIETDKTHVTQDPIFISERYVTVEKNLRIQMSKYDSLVIPGDFGQLLFQCNRDPQKNGDWVNKEYKLDSDENTRRAGYKISAKSYLFNTNSIEPRRNNQEYLVELQVLGPYDHFYIHFPNKTYIHVTCDGKPEDYQWARYDVQKNNGSHVFTQKIYDIRTYQPPKVKTVKPQWQTIEEDKK